MKQKKQNRILAALLAVAMMFQMLPMLAFAAEDTAPSAGKVKIDGTDGTEYTLEDAVKVLWKQNIYAESGMGCTGPIIRVSDANLSKAEEELKKAGYMN